MINNLINKIFDLNVLFLNQILNDAPEPWQIGFQDSAAPGFTGIVELHNTLFFYIVIIGISVFWILGNIIYKYSYKNNPINKLIDIETIEYNILFNNRGIRVILLNYPPVVGYYGNGFRLLVWYLPNIYREY